MKVALLALGMGLGLTGTALAEDLLQVYQDALLNDPQIREADATRHANREARPQAWAALLPQLNGDAQATRQHSDNTTPTTLRDPTTGAVSVIPISQKSTADTKNWGVDLRQNVFSWENWVAVRQAGKEVAQAEVNYRAAAEDLVLRAATAYFNVLAAQDVLEAQQVAMDAFSRQFDQASKRYEVGLIAITDVQEAQAARDSAAAAVIDAKRQLTAAQQALRELTNREYASLARPGEDMPLKNPDPIDVQKWVDLSMNQNLALIASRLSADIARDQVGIARGGHFPTLDIIGSHTYNKTDIDSTSSLFGSASTRNVFTTDGTVNTIGLQVSLPIFAGGLTQSRVRQTQYEWIAAKERMTRVSRQTERQARDAYLGVTSEMARVQALKQAVTSSQTALKATQAGYEVGTRTAVDVLTSQQNLALAQTNYARSRYDYLLNVLALQEAVGNLDDKALTEMNQSFKMAEPNPTPAPAPAPAPAAEPPATK